MERLDVNRVLCRLGARELTVTEAEIVSAGAGAHTNVCTALGFNAATVTHTGADGDGCGDTDVS
jgi:hypothetical protein